MRHQERIYIQDNNSCLRNKSINNFNMSSDICEFNKPTFSMLGADKIKTGTTVNILDGIHIITTSATTMDLKFSFTGNVQTFIDIETDFNYNIYKFNNNNYVFSSPPIFESGVIEYNTFSGTTSFTDIILLSNFIIDGEYLIKGFFNYKTCTSILNELGDTNNTLRLDGTKYGIYDEEFDYYFALINQAIKPEFTLSADDITTLGALRVESFIIDDDNPDEVEVSNSWKGRPIVSLNGITLMHGEFEDYLTENNTKIFFNYSLREGDIVTVAYVSDGSVNGLVSESILVANPIISGVTNGEGSERVYFNTDTNKYEVYLLTDPVDYNEVIVSLNGITLANGGDYNQSNGNKKRIILNGVINPYDIINLTYNSSATYVGVINVNNFIVSWVITPPPTNSDGFFTIVVADDNTFTNIIYSNIVPYIGNENTYSSEVDLSSYSGSDAYYKVINQKNYTLISGDVINTITESEIIPIEIIL